MVAQVSEKHADGGKIASGPKNRKGVKASIYLLPNMITAASLFFGFLAMKFGIEARFFPDGGITFDHAAYAIIAAAICDGLDGSVARLTHTQSNFGVQLDSLCDLVSFGVAPALLMYNYALHDLGRLGFAGCFIYAACGALRLARFNVQSSVGKAGGNFAGIPIPMAAMPISVFILAQTELRGWTSSNNYSPMFVQAANYLTLPNVRNTFILIMIYCLALGMVSTFEYISTKKMRLPKRKPFRFLAVLLSSLALLFAFEFTITVALFLLIYFLHGPVMWLFFKRDKSKEDDELFSVDDDEEEQA